METTEEQLKNDLFNKIPKNSNIAIYGTNNTAEKISQGMALYRNDVNIVCFIDQQNIENFENKKVYSLKNFLQNDFGVDFVVVAVMNDIIAENILDTYNIPFTTVCAFVVDYYEGKHEILNDKNYHDVINIFNDDDDKMLFDILFRRRKRIDDDRYIAQYYEKNYKNNISTARTIKKQYLEKINRNNVQVMLDLGFNTGFNTIAFNRFLPNLKMIYAFEAIYDICKNSYIEEFLPKDKIKIIKAAIGDCESKAKFYINNSNINASMISFSQSLSDKNITDSTHKIIDIEVTTIDNFCKSNSIIPDFIKMDIEGAELSAIIGATETIKNHRPQMAISIYHCDNDFINIPKYLYENLDNYTYKLGHYSPDINETILYAIPKM